MKLFVPKNVAVGNRVSQNVKILTIHCDQVNINLVKITFNSLDLKSVFVLNKFVLEIIFNYTILT